jgi:hypothetical protein
MLTREDCVALCDLTEAEIKAIAQHEHVPLLLAVEMGQYLIHLPDGTSRIRRIILDDIAECESKGRTDQARRLKAVLYHFSRNHPATRPPLAR